MQIKKLPGSLIEIEAEIEADKFEDYFSKTLQKIGENLEVPGFRKGKAPNDVLLSQVSEMRVLEEMAELAISEHYPKIIQDENLDPIGRPDIAITKLARGNPLNFKITVAVLPEIKLADYKKIAQGVLLGKKKDTKEIEVSDQELEDTILDIRKSRAPKVHLTSPQPSPATGEGESSFSSQDKEEAEVKSELPELNDEFVKALGPFENVEDFKSKLRDNMKLEKQNTQREKTRLQIIEGIIDASTLEVPEILIQAEVDKILYRMQSDIAAMGLKFEDYMKHLKKTEEDLKKEFHKDGEKKAKLALILNEISKRESIAADPELVAKEVAMILEHYKNADPERARMHAENILINERIFQFLENVV